MNIIRISRIITFRAHATLVVEVGKMDALNMVEHVVLSTGSFVPTERAHVHVRIWIFAHDIRQQTATRHSWKTKNYDLTKIYGSYHFKHCLFIIYCL